MKVFIVALLAVLALQGSYAQSHNAEWGSRQAGDDQIYRDIVQKPSSFLQVVTKDVDFGTPKTITYIKVTDQYTNDKGGYAMLSSGGPNMHDVTIHFKSQRNHGFNFILEIYGK